MTEKDKKSIEDAMIDSLAIDKVRDLIGDVAEVGLDSVLESGLLKDIPLVGFIVKSIGAGVSINDRMFAKKVLRFFTQLDDIPQHKKQEFVDSLTDKKKRHKVGETILLCLERLDNMFKADIVGRIFRAYINGKFDYSTCQRLMSAVDRVYVQDLHYLVKILHEHTETPKDPVISARLANAWMLMPQYSGGVFGTGLDLSYNVSSDGKLLVDYVLKGWLEENDDAEFDD